MRQKDLWFKAKLYGWGWTPITWQGWLATLTYCVGIVTFFTYIDFNTHSASDTLIRFIVPFLFFTGAFIALCYAKGERPRWRWGK
jgi:hypothetical protein